MAKDRKKRDLEILKNAVDKDRNGGGAPGSGGGAPGSGGGAPGSGGSGAGAPIMYRGKPVAQSGSSGAPGAPGAARRRPSQSSSNEGGDVKEALRKLTQLFNDGLITTAEYDAKRAEILNRL